MSDNLAQARARKAATKWADWEAPKAADGDTIRDARVDGFMAGVAWLLTPGTEDEVNAIIASLIRDAQMGDADDLEAAADDAALRVKAYLGAIHREEQDEWAARAKRPGTVADALAILEKIDLSDFPGLYDDIPWERLERIAGRGPVDLGPHGDEEPPRCKAEALDFPGVTSRDQASRLADAIRGAALIEEGRGWVKVHGLKDAEPLGDVLRDAYKRANSIHAPSADVVPMRRGKPEGSNLRPISNPEALGDLAALAQLATPDGGKPVGAMQSEKLTAQIGRRVVKRSGDYDFDGEIRAVIIKRSGAVRFAVEDDRGLLLVMNASQCGLNGEPVVGSQWNREGVADLTAFRLTTGDPRFSPHQPVSVNGFRFIPAAVEPAPRQGMD